MDQKYLALLSGEKLKRSNQYIIINENLSRFNNRVLSDDSHPQNIF